MADPGDPPATTANRPGVQVPPPPQTAHRPDVRTVLLVLIALVLVCGALHAASAVFVPLVAAILIALAVMPVRDWVRRRMPARLAWMGTVAAMSLLLLVLALFLGGLWIAAQQVVAEFPVRTGEIAELLPDKGAPAGEGPTTIAEGALAGLAEATGNGTEAERAAGTGEGEEGGGLLSGSGDQLAQRVGGMITSALVGVATTILNSAVSIVSALVIIFFFTLLILGESGAWRQKIASIMHPRDEWRLTESAEVIAQKVRAFLLIRAALGIATAVLYGAWLWLFDVGLIIVWSILTFLLNFIPTVGSIIAGLLPVIYLLLTQDFGTAATVGLGLLVIEQVMGNYVDPRVAGSRVAVSPLVVLVALLFWAWLWGIPGALLAVPVTVSLVVLGAHVPILQPWALLLSDRTDMHGLTEATRPR